MVQCCLNTNFEEIDTELSRGKNDGFWLPQNIMAVLRKANSHSVDICRLIKINDLKEDQGGNLFKLWFFPSW